MTKFKNIQVKKIDRKFLLILAAILVFGFFMLYSASFTAGINKFGDPAYYLKEQLFKGFLIGALLFFVFSKISMEFLKKYSFLFLIASIGLLILVFFPSFGFSHSGSTRWLSFGPIFFQPGELLKLTFLIYLASWLHSRQKDIGGLSSGLLPFLIVVGIIGVLLLMQPNMGTFGVISLSALATFFVAGGRINHIILMIFIGAAALAIFIFLKPYAAQRFKVFLNPHQDTSGAAYQINQALTSIGIGGVSGIGIRQGMVSPYLPETIGDSIFAVLSEKLGLFGITFSLALYLSFAVISYKIAMKSENSFSKLLTVGIASWIVAQSFINMAAISGLVPLTGVPLPFISYGSSGLAVALAGAGIIANISRHTI